VSDGSTKPLVVTLTVNPAIDIAASVERVVPLHKLRCTAVRRDPGGGGINVARVVRRLGVDAVAIYPAGGPIGELLRHLVENEHVRSTVVPISEETREDFTVTESASSQQYRFVLPGATMAEREWGGCLDALTATAGAPTFIVGSGSLPPGVPEDFYARVARIAKDKAARMVLDTAGRPLAAALQHGVYLVKPNLRELQELVQRPISHAADWVKAARTLVENGSAEIVALTLGHQGALLVTADEAVRARAPDVRPVSAVGAGDSFLGGMVWGLASGHSLVDAFRYGVAAGSAAVLNPGTELGRPSDVMRLYKDVQLQTL
jgi:6-phosphofructokinase 2